MTETAVPRYALSKATLLGLFLALVVPTVLGFAAAAVYGTTLTESQMSWGIAVHWLNFAALIAVVIFVEHQRPASIGLRSLRWGTIPLGLVAGLAIIPISGFLAHVMGGKSDARFAVFMQSLPFTTRLLLVITAGIFEETLFRGYALERLASLFNNKWWAAAVTVAVFAIAHIPAVGLTYLLPVFIMSVLVTLLYLWRRDLVVNIVAHVTIDGVGLLLIPLLAHHGAA